MGSTQTTAPEHERIRAIASLLSNVALKQGEREILELMSEGSNEIEVARKRSQSQKSIEMELFNVYRATNLLGSSPEERGIWLGKAYKVVKASARQASGSSRSNERQERVANLAEQIRSMSEFRRKLLTDVRDEKSILDMAAERGITERDVLGHITNTYKALELSTPPSTHDKELVRDATNLLSSPKPVARKAQEEPVAKPMQIPVPVKAEPAPLPPVQSPAPAELATVPSVAPAKPVESPPAPRVPSAREIKVMVQGIKALPPVNRKILPFLAKGLRHEELANALGNYKAHSAEAMASGTRQLIGVPLRLSHEERTAFISAAYEAFEKEGGWGAAIAQEKPRPKAHLPSYDEPIAPDSEEPAAPLLELLRGATTIALKEPETITGARAILSDTNDLERQWREMRAEGYFPEYLNTAPNSQIFQVIFLKRERA